MGSCSLLATHASRRIPWCYLHRRIGRGSRHESTHSPCPGSLCSRSWPARPAKCRACCSFAPPGHLLHKVMPQARSAGSLCGASAAKPCPTRSRRSPRREGAVAWKDPRLGHRLQSVLLDPRIGLSLGPSCWRSFLPSVRPWEAGANLQTDPRILWSALAAELGCLVLLPPPGACCFAVPCFGGVHLKPPHVRANR